MIKYLFMLTFVFIGCNTSTKTTQDTFIDDNRTAIVFSQHIDMCNKTPNDMFCVTTESLWDVQPTKEYALNLAVIMYENTEYNATREWYHNDDVHQELVGDCEDIAMTIIAHMVHDGTNTKYLQLGYELTSETTAHIFVIVDSIDYGKIHIDYPNSGYAVGRYNWYMDMNDTSTLKWKDGNIDE